MPTEVAKRALHKILVPHFRLFEGGRGGYSCARGNSIALDRIVSSKEDSGKTMGSLHDVHKHVHRYEREAQRGARACT